MCLMSQMRTMTEKKLQRKKERKKQETETAMESEIKNNCMAHRVVMPFPEHLAQSSKCNIH